VAKLNGKERQLWGQTTFKKLVTHGDPKSKIHAVLLPGNKEKADERSSRETPARPAIKKDSGKKGNERAKKVNNNTISS